MYMFIILIICSLASCSIDEEMFMLFPLSSHINVVKAMKTDYKSDFYVISTNCINSINYMYELFLFYQLNIFI